MKTIEELEAALAAATQGDWKFVEVVEEWPGAADVDGTYSIKVESNTVIANNATYYNKAPSPQDGLLIALMKNNLPSLIEAAKALDELVLAIKFIPLGVHPLVKLNAATIALEKLK